MVRSGPRQRPYRPSGASGRRRCRCVRATARRLRSAAGRVTLQRLHLDLGGPTSMPPGPSTGSVAACSPAACDGHRRRYGAAAERGSRRSAAGSVAERLARKARSWVIEHIHDGVAGAAGRVGAHVDLTPGAARPVRLVAFGARWNTAASRVEYFRPLSPLRGVDGTASFDRNPWSCGREQGGSSGFKFRPAR